MGRVSPVAVKSCFDSAHQRYTIENRACARQDTPLVAHQGARRHLLDRDLAARVGAHLDLTHVESGTELRLQLAVPLVVPGLLALCLERCANLLGSAP